MKTKRYLLTGIGVLVLAATSASAAESRVWTDTQGRKVQAAFIKLDGDTIYLQTADGTVYPLPVARFSAEDQALAKSLKPAEDANVLAQVPTNATAAQAAAKIDQLVKMGLQRGNLKMAEAYKKSAAEDVKAGKQPKPYKPLAENPKCSDEQFVRRVYIDIVGRIPSYEETAAFLKSGSTTKRAELIDKLLDSDGYVSAAYDYFADMFRVKDKFDGADFVRGLPYTQWLKEQIAKNQPWNKIAYEMITANGKVWNNGAAGYLLRDSGMPLDNLANTLTVFLGTDVACAQCHDHPFTDWTQMQFYQMASFFGATTTRLNGKDFANGDPGKKLQEDLVYQIEKTGGDPKKFRNLIGNVIGANRYEVRDRETNSMKLPHDYKYKDGAPNDPVAPKLIMWSPKDKENPAYKAVEAELGTKAASKSKKAKEASMAQNSEGLRDTFGKWMVADTNPRFAMTIANRLWARAFGLGFTQSVKSIDSVEEASNPELLKHLGNEMVRLKFNMKDFMRVLYNTQTYQREATTEDLAMGEPYYFQGPILRRMTAEQAWDSYMTLVLGEGLDKIKNTEADPYGRAIDMDLEKTTMQTLASKITALQNLNKEAQKKMGGSLADAGGKTATKGGKASKDDEDMMMEDKIVNYNGMKLMRASELEQPAPPGHFLREFGQSERLVGDSNSKAGSVPQVLTLMNGKAQDMLTNKDSLIHRTLKTARDPAEKTEMVFLSVLSRHPTLREKDIAKKEIQAHGDEGYSNMIWALINTREFTFVQ